MMNAKSGPACLKKMAMTCAALATAATAHGQLVIHVDDDAAANGDGLTWDTALNDLQTALFLARVVPGDLEIRVGAGLYLPSQTGDRAASFDLDRTSMQSAVTLTIKGGFRGLSGGGDPNDRDLDDFRTVLSGDLDGNDEPGFVNYDDNSLTVLRISRANVRAKTWIDGFFIRGANTSSTYRGGGVSLRAEEGVAIRLTNCVLSENSARNGGGAYVWGDVQIGNSLFVGNRATGWGGATYAIDVIEQPSFINCTFTDNEAPRGAAIYAASGQPIAANCIVFNDSESNAIDGGLYLLYSCVSEFYPGEGNIVADPGFVDPENSDYRIGAGSPCIDSANTRLTPRDLYVDLGGDARLFDDPVSSNRAGSFGIAVDMGAFEYQGCDIDFNGDGQGNTVDLLMLLNFLNDGCP